MHEINQTLIDVADWRVRGNVEKEAFVPTPTDPAAAAGGGMPPGMPPDGQMPADPMAMGGGMPPAMGGGMPPAAGGAPPMLDPIIQQSITQAVQAAMQQGGAGGEGSKVAGPGKGAKVDPGLLYMELGRIRKMMTTMFQNLGWELPPDILDDTMVAQAVSGGAPAGQPTNAGAPPAPPEQPPLPPGIDPANLQGAIGKAGHDNSVLSMLFGSNPSTVTAESIAEFAKRADAFALIAQQAINAK